MHGEGDGGAREDGERGRWPVGHGLGGQPEDDAVLFDIEELNIEWSEWLPGVDYTQAIRAAEHGEAAMWRHQGRRSDRIFVPCLHAEWNRELRRRE
jgi:hypothetical protein